LRSSNSLKVEYNLVNGVIDLIMNGKNPKKSNRRIVLIQFSGNGKRCLKSSMFIGK
jgi:hypothetical protein